MNAEKLDIPNPIQDCDRFLTCVDEHHLILDGVASHEMIEFYQTVGTKCAPCSKHFEELKALRMLVQKNIIYSEPSHLLESKILQAIKNSP